MIDQADDLRKLLASFSKAANAPLAEKKKGMGGVAPSAKESAGCEVRGAENSAQRTTHDAQSLNKDAQRTTHDAQSLNKDAQSLNKDALRTTHDAQSLYVAVSEEDQGERGLYMIGQIAALHDRVCTIEELHQSISQGGAEELLRVRERESEACESGRVETPQRSNAPTLQGPNTPTPQRSKAKYGHSHYRYGMCPAKGPGSSDLLGEYSGRGQRD